MPLRLEIVTPEARAYSDDVDMVVLPGVEGEMGIYPMHVPMMTQIKPGELVVTKGRETLHLAVGEGFVEITQTTSTSSPTWRSKSSTSTRRSRKKPSSAPKRRCKPATSAAKKWPPCKPRCNSSLAQLHVKRRRQGGKI